MKSKHVLFFIFLLLLLQSSYRSHAQFNTGDSLALVDLYTSTNGAGWKKSTRWLTAAPLNTWYGVTTAGTRVTGLALSYNRLKGALPASLGNLTMLGSLDLQSNGITSVIPSSIGNLTQLTYLNFGSNQITGAIPVSMGSLAQLTILYLDRNKLKDNIPSSIGNLVKLTELRLEYNQLTGLLPASIGNLTEVTSLGLSNNMLSGVLPSSLYNLTKMYNLALSDNRFSGRLSSLVSNFVNIAYLFLQDNQFTGTIPATIGNLKNIYTINLTNNRFSGRIPAAISGCSGLTDFEVENNELSGHVPAVLGELPLLTYLSLSNNNLTGELPLQLFTGDRLRELVVPHNHLTASQNYKSDKKTTSLDYLNISYNNYTFNGLEYEVTVIEPLYSNQAPLNIHTHGNKLAVNAGGTLRNNTYTWYKTGSSVAVAKIRGDSTFQPAGSGHYFANITNRIVSYLTLTTDTVSYSTTFSAAETMPVVSLYPNPAKEFLLIRGLNGNDEVKVTIADMNGYVWLSANSRKQSLLKISISQLKRGNYLVSMRDGNALTTFPFIKE